MIRFERLGTVLVPQDERHAKFNSGALLLNGTVHLLYRWAQIEKPSGGFAPRYVQNYIAYACMTPEGKLIADHDRMAFQQTHIWESCGLEDPRVFRLDGQNYITYTAFDGVCPRVGFAKANDDFSIIEKIGIVPALRWDKDAFLFPERIHGKIAYVHRFEPNIQIDYFDDFDELFDEDFWKNYTPERGGSVALQAEQDWEKKKIGGSVPPIRTEKGWLFIYHGVSDDRKPFCYRVGMALLDPDHPSRTLARLEYPVLEPQEPYETTGDVDQVVFPCGGYIYDGYLYLVYGGADKVTALARCPMADILEEFEKRLSENPLTRCSI